MTRKDFITELEKLLWELPEDERAEAISYYENYFDDGEIKEEDIVSSKVDSPVSIANSIKDDYFANNPNAIRNQRNTSFETAEPFSYDYGNHTTSDDKSFANGEKATSNLNENKTNAYANLNEEKTTSSNKNEPYFYSSEGANSKKSNEKDYKKEFYGQADGGEYEEDPSKSKIANLWGKFKYWFNKQETIIKVLIIVG
ncbi:MAG: DUF1700 domain-containing protein, partial [Lachnospiraceae bacterium]|nr:DUF1700 domain-containing protein [Lachnospiraceae bacterium]